MGKTFGGLTPTVEYFKRMGLSQIDVTEKVSFCYKLTTDFKFIIYKNLMCIITEDNVVIQLDSLHQINCAHDAVYLDEFKGLITSFDNPTLRS